MKFDQYCQLGYVLGCLRDAQKQATVDQIMENVDEAADELAQLIDELKDGVDGGITVVDG